MKDTVRYIFYIVLILAIGIGATYFGRYVNRKFLGIERYDETIKSFRDSLNSFIKKYDKIIKEQQFVIDSLRGIKQKTITIHLIILNLSRYDLLMVCCVINALEPFANHRQISSIFKCRAKT